MRELGWHLINLFFAGLLGLDHSAPRNFKPWGWVWGVSVTADGWAIGLKPELDLQNEVAPLREDKFSAFGLRNEHLLNLLGVSQDGWF